MARASGPPCAVCHKNVSIRRVTRCPLCHTVLCIDCTCPTPTCVAYFQRLKPQVIGDK